MENILQFLGENPGPWAFVLLVACGLGLPPWSEELVTVGMGYFVAQDAIPMVTGLIWCWAGLLAGDTVVFWLGQYVGERVYRWPILRRHVGPKRRHRFNRFFLKNGTKAVFLARFIPGFRIIAYFVAGNLRMPYWKFAVLDSIGAAVYVPAGVGLGYFFADNLDKGLSMMRDFEIPLAILGALIVLLLARRWGRRRKQRLEELLRLRAERHRGRESKSPSEVS